MAIVAGARIDASDIVVPDPVVGVGASTNTIVATSWAVLPSNPASVSITNPHADADLLCLVTYTAWVKSTTTGWVQAGFQLTGDTTMAAPGPGDGIGDIVAAYASLPWTKTSGTVPVTLSPGTTTAEMVARTSGTGTQNVDYPVIRIVPLRYLFA
jgi:hypothetical protein